MSQLIDFYTGEGTDAEGRYLEETLAWSHAKIEYAHDAIQWWFPLPKPSNFNPDAPILTNEDIKLWTVNPLLTENLLRSFRVYLDFLGLEFCQKLQFLQFPLPDKVEKAVHFKEDLFKYPNHNWLRITRVIRCLKTIGTPSLVAATDAFFECLYKLHNEEKLVSENAFAYWERANAVSSCTKEGMNNHKEKKMNVENSVDEILDVILKDKSADEQIKTLRSIYNDAVGHGWVDDELRDSVLSNLCREYNIPYHSVEDEDDTD